MKEVPKDVTECDFCRFETKKLKYIEHTIKYGENKEVSTGWLCDCCYHTFCSNAFMYPKQYDGQHIMKQISYIGNMILEKMKG